MVVFSADPNRFPWLSTPALLYPNQLPPFGYKLQSQPIQALGISPDIIVEQPRRVAEDDEEATDTPRRSRSEADLRGSLNNDSLTEDEILQIEADREKAEAAAKLRKDEYQMAYAIDILKGLSALAPK